jgi:hypothetical protein
VLVPIILRLSARFVEGKLSESMVDFGVGQKYYVFQIVVCFQFIMAMASSKCSAPCCEASAWLAF